MTLSSGYKRKASFAQAGSSIVGSKLFYFTDW